MEQPAVGEHHGFVHALCECGRTDQWLTCNACRKSDRFVLSVERATCVCGASYTHALCACGKQVPRERLDWVAWDKGPPALGDWELDPVRTAIAILVAVGALAVLGLVAWRLVAG